MPTPPAADGTVVLPGAVVRQGQTDITLTLNRAAGGLANPSRVTLDGLSAVVASGSSDVRLVLTVSVPHGTAPGKRTLQVMAATGELTIADAVEVTAITASPAGADGDANWGSAAAPFRTLKRALAVAGPGDTVNLLDGLYDGASGESWDYQTPPQVSIVGQSRAGTILRGPAGAGGSPDPPSPSPSISGVRPGDGLTLRTLSLAGFQHAVSVEVTAAVTLDEVDITGAQDEAIVIAPAAQGSTLTVQGAAWSIVSTAASGISADAPGAAVTVNGGTIKAAHHGIAFGEHCAACRLDLQGTAVTSGGDDNHAVFVLASDTALGTRTEVASAIFNGDIFVDDSSATLSVTGTSVVEAFANNGIYFNGAQLAVKDSTITVTSPYYGVQLQGGVMTLSGVTIDGGTYGIYHSAGTATLRGTTIKNFAYVGYYLSTGDLDLGTKDETGGNTFSGPDNGYGLYVARLGPAKPVTCSNTSFNGELPLPGDVTGAVDLKGRFFINVGEVVSFSMR
ncbi:MAG: hypothetical protein QOI66_227 [Myxococcales bacterium]|jgi:hypothetical protein|nr:hypothetical protein [Myxococcales bacterium]